MNLLHPFPSQMALEGRQLQWCTRAVPRPRGDFCPPVPEIFCCINQSRYFMSGHFCCLWPCRELDIPPLLWIISYNSTQHWGQIRWRQAGISFPDSSCYLFHGTGHTGSGNQEQGTPWLGTQVPYLAHSKKVLFSRANHHPGPRLCPMEEVDHALEVNVSLRWL